MKVSIITICYNDKEGFGKTAKSIISQTCKDFEWIIIDGGSSDGSAELINETVKSLQGHCETTDLVGYSISEKDNGIYNAMNKGLRHAKGDYIQFLNSGDYLVNKNSLAQITPLLVDKDLYVADICHSDDPEQKPGFHIPVDLTDEQLVYQLMYFTLPHPSSFFKRDFFDRFGYFDESLKVVSDWKLYFRSLILGNASIQILPFITTVFDPTGISSTGNKSEEERKAALYEYPRLNSIISYYCDTYEMVSALQSKWYGRFIMRFGFYFFRTFNKR